MSLTPQQSGGPRATTARARPAFPVAAPRPRRAVGRTQGLLLGIATAVLGLVAYQGAVSAFGGDEAAFVIPGAGAMLSDEGDPAPPSPSLEASSAPPTEVRVDITWRARLRPLPPPPACRVMVGDHAVSDAGVEWLAGSASLPLQRVRPGDVQLVRLRVHGEDTLRLSKVQEAGLELRLCGRVQVSGQVIDTDGRGLARARVWAAGTETITADDGTFAVEAIGGEGLPVVAIAEGMAAQTVMLNAWSDSTVRFVMQPGATLRVRVTGALPRGGEPAQVFLLPSSEPRTSAEAQYPFFLQALAGGVLVNDKGVATFDHLPISARLRVRLRHDQVVAEEMPLVETRARPTEISLLAESGAVVRGRVVDTDGTKVANARVATWPEADGDEVVRGPAADLALPPLAYVGRGTVALALADGTFCLARSMRYTQSRLLACGPSPWAAEVVVRGNSSALEHDLTLPTRPLPAVAGAASLALHAAQPGNYRVRVHENGGAPRSPTSWNGTAPFAIAVRAGALADVRVTVGVAGAARERTLTSLTIVEPVPVDLPGLPR